MKNHSLINGFITGGRFRESPIVRRLVHGSSWSIFGAVTSRLLVLVSMILVARLLGKASFGEFGLIQATLGVVGLMAGLGLGSTATRFVAQYAAIDPKRAGRVIALVMSVSIATVFLAGGTLVAASDFIARKVLEASYLSSALMWGSLLMIATALRGIQSGVLAGLEKFDLIAKLNILDGVLSFVTMLLLAQLMGVEGALLGLAFSSTVVWLVGRNLLAVELLSRGIDFTYDGCWADWRILTSYSLPSLLGSLVATPVLWLAMLLVTRSEGGFAGLGIYNAAYQWHGPMVFIPMIIMSVSIPVLVQEWETGNKTRFRKVTFWICGLMLALSLPPTMIAAFLSHWIMNLYGPEFSDGWLVLVLLLVAAPFHSLAKIAFGALYGMNCAWWVFGCNLIWGASLIIFTERLVSQLGVMALAIGFLASHAIISFLSLILVFIGSKNKLKDSKQNTVASCYDK